MPKKEPEPWLSSYIQVEPAQCGALLEQFRQGDKNAADLLLRCHLRFLWSQSYELWLRDRFKLIDREDVMAILAGAFFEAMKSYDAKRGCSLTTYARPFLVRAFLYELAQRGGYRKRRAKRWDFRKRVVPYKSGMDKALPHSGFSAVENQDELAVIRKRIEKLDNIERSVFEHLYGQEKKTTNNSQFRASLGLSKLSYHQIKRRVHQVLCGQIK